MSKADKVISLAVYLNIFKKKFFSSRIKTFTNNQFFVTASYPGSYSEIESHGMTVELL